MNVAMIILLILLCLLAGYAYYLCKAHKENPMMSLICAVITAVCLIMGIFLAVLISKDSNQNVDNGSNNQENTEIQTDGSANASDDNAGNVNDNTANTENSKDEENKNPDGTDTGKQGEGQNKGKPAGQQEQKTNTPPIGQPKQK